MRLKEIKPGMVIHCKTEEEIKRSLIELDKLGCEWVTNDKLKYSGFLTTRNDVCFHVRENMKISWSDFSEAMNEKTEITEFSDLIIPELSAKEVLETMKEICKNVKGCVDCPFNGECNPAAYLFDAEKVVDACTKWREEHPKEEKKELETEWVYVIRIIKVHDNGKKECVHEVDSFVCSDDVYIPQHTIEESAERELKDYCNNHEGNFFATLEHICRIKE